MDLVGTITLSFYFLENPRRNAGSQIPRKVVDLLDTVPEKAVKGEAISHQLRYEDPSAHLSSRLGLLSADAMIAFALHRTL